MTGKVGPVRAMPDGPRFRLSGRAVPSRWLRHFNRYRKGRVLMNEVTTIYDNWGNRASIKEPNFRLTDARVFNVGGYTVTVPDDVDEPAKVTHQYNKWGASENPMPNMSFSDGEMRIPVEDFADLILRRVPAVELAEGLWRDDDVREAFVECMVNRYRGAVDDADRRAVLLGLQQEIYAKSIDQAIERLNDKESHLRAYTNRSRWEGLQMGHYEGLYKAFKETLFEMREKGLLDDEQIDRRLKCYSAPESLKEYFSSLADPVASESVGKQWQESRDYWRVRLEAFFPDPAQGIEAASADETQSGSAEGESPVAESDAPKGGDQ